MNGQKYDGFRIIAERNIFNPNRSPRVSRQPRDERRVNRADAISLVGTLSYEKGAYAFFDGARSEWKKVVEVGQTIAEHKVIAIGNDAITLQLKTNTLRLAVGGRLRRGESGWEAVGGIPPPANATTTASNAPPGDDSDIIKKLMAQREKELNGAD